MNWIVFDLGGVLVRITLNFEEAARSVGLRLPIGWAYESFPDYPPFIACQAGMISSEEYLRCLAREAGFSEADAGQLHDAIILSPFPGSLEFLTELKGQGFRLGILSNTNARHWKCLMDTDRFPALAECELPVASHLLGLEKPDPAIYRRWAVLAGADGGVVFFDDSEANVVAARREGWTAYRVDPTGDPVAQMRVALLGFPPPALSPQVEKGF